MSSRACSAEIQFQMEIWFLLTNSDKCLPQEQKSEQKSKLLIH